MPFKSLQAFKAQKNKGIASLLPAGSLARHLVLRLLPPIILLAILDLVMTWIMTHQVQVSDWSQEDIFWLMAVGQSILIGLFAWVVVHGVRSGMKAVTEFAEEISLRSADDLAPVKIEGLPLELDLLVRHTNALLSRMNETFEAQRRFVGHAAHQLRTPLAGLKLESELMLAKDLPADIRVRAERIKRVSDRMIRLGQQLLLLARVDPDARPQDHFVRLDLCEWVRSSAAEWLSRTREAQICLELEAPDEAVWVDGDPILLDQMLGNLIDNVLLYAEQADTIKIQVTSTPPTLAVEDNGCGIRPQEQSRVFEAFYRSPQAMVGGSGLGLAIVREIARAHGAWWNLLSVPAIAGTRMTVVFPGPRIGAQLTRMDRFSHLH
jgi:two-component system sensor histidine kinase TctE